MAWINYARVMSIFAVVLLHASVTAITESPVGSMPWWVGNIYDSAVRWSVPVFVMLSGALLLAPKDESNRDFYHKRLAKILVPLLFWSFAYVVWRVLKILLKADAGGLNQISVMFNQLFYDLLSGKPYYHLWFLYMIVGLYLFTPFLRTLIQHSSRQNLWLLTLMMLAFAMLQPMLNLVQTANDNTIFTLFLAYLPYYLLGYLLTSTDTRLPRTMLYSVVVACVLVTALSFAEVGMQINVGVGSYFYDYLSITVVPMSLAVFLLFKGNQPLSTVNDNKHQDTQNSKDRRLSWLAGLTFGIYLIHPIPLEILRFMGVKAELFLTVVTVPVVAIITFLLALLITWLLKKMPYLQRIV